MGDVGVVGARPRRVRRARLALVVAVLAVLAAGCEADGTWVDMAPVAAGTQEVPADENGDVDCWAPAGCVVTAQDATSVWDGTAWRDVTPEGWVFSLQAPRQQVSCASASACLTTGRRGDTGAPFRWNGSGWVPTPDPAGTFTPDRLLAMVSCGSPTSCLGVRSASGGADAMVRWDGTAWSEVAAPTAEPWGGAAVACSSATDCVAFYVVVGVVQAARWNGSTWAALPATGFDHQNHLSLACPTARTCVAVGLRDEGWRIVRLGVATWDAVAVPGIDGFPIDPDLACVRGNDTCPVIGQANVGDRQQMVEVRVGPTTVELADIPQGAAWNWFSLAAACGATDSCLVIVDDQLGFGEGGRFVGAGSTWTRTPPAPGRSYTAGLIDAVDCPTDTFCAAVASGVGAQVWDGAAWRAVTAPVGIRDSGRIDCTSPVFCLATGTYFDEDGGALALRWDGTAFTGVPMPSVGTIFDVTCWSEAQCVVASGSTGELLRYDGSGFTPMPRPEIEVSGLSCLRADWCMAAGRDASETRARVAHWNGATWAVDDAVDPARTSWFHDIACDGEQLCVAAGGTGSELLVGTWDGTVWRHSRPSVARGVQLRAVSCAGGRCMAPGFESDYAPVKPVIVTTDEPATLAWEWTPALPSVEAVPIDVPAVACRPDWCLVAGVQYPSTGGYEPLAWRFVPE